MKVAVSSYKSWKMNLRLLAITIALPLALITLPANGQIANVISTSFGAANRGAATAMPLDATNSQYWNPASITDLETTELDLNTQPYFPSVSLSSALDAGALAPGTPPTSLSGQTYNSQKFGVLSSLGFVKKFEHSPWTVGVLLTNTIGPGERFKQSSNNPILTPPFPEGVGLGEFKENGQTIFIAPTLARRLGKNWSVGVQPNIEIASLLLAPLIRVPPDDANRDGIPTYPRPEHEAWTVGMGVQGGVYYKRKNIHLGASLKSPQWFLPYRFTSKNEIGETRHDSFFINNPMTLSTGIGYTGIPRLKLATDARYINYSNTAGYDQSGFAESGAVRGTGWRNIWAWVNSAHYQVTKKLALRGVYAYGEMPIRPYFTQFSIGAPAVIKHQMSVGLSYKLYTHFTIAASYQHGFFNSVQGPYQIQRGAIPGSAVKLKGSLNSFAVSLIFK